MKLTIETKKNRNLTRAEKELINKNRIKHFGKSAAVKDFKKNYEPNTEWFFVKAGGKIVSLLGLRPIKVKYLGKTYKIGGICSLISIKKKLGYGRVLIAGLLTYLRKTGKSALGFTGQTEFCKKAGLGAKKDFIKRFVYVNPKTGEKVIDEDGDGVYYNGKDNLIKKILSTKGTAYIEVMHW